MGALRVLLLEDEGGPMEAALARRPEALAVARPPAVAARWDLVLDARGDGRGTAALMYVRIGPDGVALDGWTPDSVDAWLGATLDRARLARDLSRARRDLARARLELDQFASVVSHDLRSPLQVISGYAELLAVRYRGRLDAHAVTLIDRTLKGVEQLERQIQDLLTVTRLPGEAEPVATVDLADAWAAAVAVLAADGRLDPAGVTTASLPVVAGNPVQLAHLLRLLLQSAAALRGPAPLKVHAEARAVEEGWRVEVRDNGRGLDPRFVPRIFGTTTRGVSLDDPDRVGTPLLVCRRIVERHGGVMGVEPRPGGGTVWWFTLPDG